MFAIRQDHSIANRTLRLPVLFVEKQIVWRRSFMAILRTVIFIAIVVLFVFVVIEKF